MSSIYETTSGKAYANDPDYDRMTGYVTKTYQTEWRDIHGNLWRKTCTVINLGRSDAVTPANENAEIESPEDDLPVRSAKSEHRRKIFGMLAQRYLRQFGPASCRELAYHLNTDHESLRRHFIEHIDTIYCQIWVNKRKVNWGLVGIHDVQPGEAA